MNLSVLPPFTAETAALRVRQAEDAWNLRDTARIALASAPNSQWRNRTEVIRGRAEIIAFLGRKWANEMDCRLIQEIWATEGARLSLRFACEWHDGFGNWYRSFGSEAWEFDDAGLIRRRLASINDVGIAEEDRQFHWPPGPRPPGHPGLTELGL